MRTPLPTFLETRTFLWHALYETSFVPREKKISRSSALKVLDHAMIGPEGTDNCHKFVDILGLRTIFPLFMKSPRKIKKVGTTEKEHEGRVHWRNQPTLGALEGMGVGNESYFEKLWCAVEERTLRATFFFFFLPIFCAWKCSPETPDHGWSLLLWFSAPLNPVVPFPSVLLISLCVRVLFSLL